MKKFKKERTYRKPDSIVHVESHQLHEHVPLLKVSPL